MEKIFYGKINPSLNVPEAQRYFPDPLEPNRFDEAIEELGGIDTLVGGVGCKGLVAFNECPASPYHRVSLEEYAQSKSRIVTLREDTIIAYAEREFGACFDALPPNAFTIGMKSMLKAQRAVFVVTTGVETDGSTGGFIQRTDNRISVTLSRYVLNVCCTATGVPRIM
ncbi:MAG: hypothetical protein ACLRXC_00605 [[Clostridium] leptum]